LHFDPHPGVVTDIDVHVCAVIRYQPSTIFDVDYGHLPPTCVVLAIAGRGVIEEISSLLY
jgi:hypothetical protein